MGTFLQALGSAENLPLLLAFVGLGGFLIGLGVGAEGHRARRKFVPRGRGRASLKLVHPDGKFDARTDHAAQLTSVMNAEFKAKRLMSKNEARTFLNIERELRRHEVGWRVMAQVSLGEVLTSPDAQAYSAVNSKRVDMLIIARDGHPLAAVEFQGSGHYLGTAAARDAVKREALRRAGVDFIEVKADHSNDDLVFEIARLVRAKAATTPRPD